MCVGLIGLIFVIFEIFDFRKAANMVAADFPRLTAEQLELKRLRMKQSAWWLLSGAIFLVVVGNLLLVVACNLKSESGEVVAYCVGGGGFLISLVVSAIYGSAAARLK